jgi:AcrR family transcriptional regulator
VKSKSQDESPESALDRRQRLLDAGLALLDERALAGASVDTISDRAAVAHGLLFHYFASKKKFFVEVLRETFRRLGDQFESHHEASGRAWIETDIDIVIDTYHRYDAAVVVAQSVGVSTDLALLQREIQDRMTTRFAGRLGVKNLSPIAELALVGWQNSVLSTVGAWLARGEPSRDVLVAYLADSFVAVLRSISEHDESFDVDVELFDPTGPR